MTPDEYQKLAGRTECDQLKSSHRMYVDPSSNPMDRPKQLEALRRVRLNHAVVGLAGEVGELAGAVEGWVYYGKDLDVTNVKEELGDLCWYVAEACNALGLSLSDVMEANIRKLQVRYPEKYTDEAAANRDLEAEAKALENQPWNDNQAWKYYKEAEAKALEDDAKKNQDIRVLRGSSSTGASTGANYYRNLGQRADKGEHEPTMELRAKTREIGMDWKPYPSWEYVGDAVDRSVANTMKPQDESKYYQTLGKVVDATGDDKAIRELQVKAKSLSIDLDSYESWEDVGQTLDASTLEDKPKEEMIDNGHGWREPKMDES